MNQNKEEQYDDDLDEEDDIDDEDGDSMDDEELLIPSPTALPP